MTIGVTPPMGPSPASDESKTCLGREESPSSALHSILVVDDEAHIASAIAKALHSDSILVDTALTGQGALEKLNNAWYDLVICDLKLPDIDGLELIEKIHRDWPDISVVVITGYASIETAIRAIRIGAQEYIPKPFRPSEVRLAVEKIIRQRRLIHENIYLKGSLEQIWGSITMVTNSTSMKRLLSSVPDMAPTSSPILVTGETGAGKEVLARFIHSQSRRAGAFVAVNCAAIPETLLESELFGHIKGAFTGAVCNRKGAFEQAEGGTLFLDEIGEMPLPMQPKLLRVLEEKAIQRLGAESKHPVNFRIIAASNQNLEEKVQQNLFRPDLFYRLDVIRLAVPPLRERREDVAPLAETFLTYFQRELKKPLQGFSAEAFTFLEEYPWPGNIRQLKNVIERIVLLARPGEQIQRGLLSQLLGPLPREKTLFRLDREKLPSLEAFQREYMDYVLKVCEGNKTKAVQILKISPTTLWRYTSQKFHSPEP